jgi:muconate cycloisomerase
MLIENFRIYRLQIPFSLPVSHNLADRGQSEALLVSAISPEGISGYGEGTPRTYVTGEDIETCIEAASEICGLIKNLPDGNTVQIESILDKAWNQPAAYRHPSAFCAVELSILDLYARLGGRPLWNLFAPSPARDEFTYSAVIPMLSQSRLSDLLDYIDSQDILYAKVKVSDVEGGMKYTAGIRRRLGQDINIRVDANGAFSGKQAVEFIEASRAEKLNISALEQPAPADDFEAMKRVTQLGIPVFADESFCNEQDMRRLMDHRACSGFNIRLSKCGGFRNSLRLYHLARKHGFVCQIGCHVGETAVLASAGRHLAALCKEIAFFEGSYSNHVLKEDISVEHVTFGKGGKAALLPGAGTGITIHSDALARWGTLVHEV